MHDGYPVESFVTSIQVGFILRCTHTSPAHVHACVDSSKQLSFVRETNMQHRQSYMLPILHQQVPKRGERGEERRLKNPKSDPQTPPVVTLHRP